VIVTTSPDLPGHKILEAIGIVKGSSIRARHIGKDIIAGLRNIVGGEIHE